MTTRKLALPVIIGLALTVVSATVSARAYPEQVVRVVVPYAPAGGADLVARVYAEGRSKRLGQQVIVENRPGANGNVGADFVVRAKPDGYTLLLSASTALTPS